jgi:amino-acid N-acetyltransferase
VRHATIADIGGLLAIIEPLEQKGALVRRSRELLETEIDRFSVVEIDGMVVGCAGLYPYPDGTMAELAAVATHADYLGKGIAKRLLSHVESQAKSRGYGQLFVLTTQTAHWFLERGFVEGTLDDLPAEKQSLYNLQRRSKVFIKTL